VTIRDETANEPSKAFQRLALGIVTLVAAALLARLGGFDLSAARTALSRVGAAAWFALVPFGLLLVVDATAWAISLGVGIRPVMLARLVQARLGIEAVSLTVPGSILVSDGIAPVVFGRSASIQMSTAVGGVAVKKWGIILGHVVVLAFASFVGGAFFDRVEADEGLRLSPRLAIGIACVVGLAACVWLSSLLTNGAAERLRRTLGRIPLQWSRRLTDRAVESAARTDTHAKAFFTGSRSRLVGLVVVSTFVWVAESVEVYVLFRILGASPAFVQVLAMEALLTIVRSVAFFSPGGLGAQELAYLTLIPPLLGHAGIELASGFVILRRFRDVVTIALGYLALANRVVRG